MKEVAHPRCTAHLIGHLIEGVVPGVHILCDYRIYSERWPTLMGGIFPVELCTASADTFADAQEDLIRLLFTTPHLRHIRPWFFPGWTGRCLRSILQYRAVDEAAPHHLTAAGASQVYGESDDAFVERLLLMTDPGLAELDCYNPFSAR